MRKPTHIYEAITDEEYPKFDTRSLQGAILLISLKMQSSKSILSDKNVHNKSRESIENECLIPKIIFNTNYKHVTITNGQIICSIPIAGDAGIIRKLPLQNFYDSVVLLVYKESEKENLEKHIENIDNGVNAINRIIEKKNEELNKMIDLVIAEKNENKETAFEKFQSLPYTTFLGD